MRIVATTSLCVAVGASSVLHLVWKKCGRREGEKWRQKKRECETRGRQKKREREKHFRKEWHGTETRRPLKPADNPADWFGHIRDGSELRLAQEYVSTGWNTGTDSYFKPTTSSYFWNSKHCWREEGKQKQSDGSALPNSLKSTITVKCRHTPTDTLNQGPNYTANQRCFSAQTEKNGERQVLS